MALSSSMKEKRTRGTKTTHLTSAFKNEGTQQLIFFKALSVNSQDMPLVKNQPNLPLADFLDVPTGTLRILVRNALQLKLTSNIDTVFRPLREETEKYNDGYLRAMVALHIDRIKEVNVSSLPFFVYLACIEYALTLGTTAAKKRRLREQSVRLPDSDRCAVLANMINNMASLMSPTNQMVINPSLEGGYSKVITSGTVDAMTDDTLWIWQLQSCNQSISDHYPLLAAWLMLQRSHQYKDNAIRYVSIMSPWKGKYTRIDVAHLTPAMIDELREFIYPVIQQYEFDLP